MEQIRKAWLCRPLDFGLQASRAHTMPSFSRTTHRLDGLKQWKFILSVLEPSSQKSRCWQGWFLVRAGREGSTLDLSSWPVDGHFLLIYLHIIFSVGMSASGSKFPSFKDTSHIGLESILNNSF